MQCSSPTRSVETRNDLLTQETDTVKVRLQLQGQVLGHPPFFTGPLNCITKTVQMEGYWALQKGLSSAINREITKNLFRIGMFDSVIELVHQRKERETPVLMWERIVAGTVTGMLGAITSSPFELIRTRTQAFVPGDPFITHEHQKYAGLMDAIRTIVKYEGWKALFRGSMLSLTRSAVGSAVNLTAYSALREQVLKFNQDSPLNDALCGTASSLVTVAVINPIDVIRTRIFNQPAVVTVGESPPGYVPYRNGFDAFLQILKLEGPMALYKGFFSSFMRLGPHFIITFMLLEQFKRWSLEYTKTNYERERDKKLRKLFDQFDVDRNQALDVNELTSLLKKSLPNENLLTDEQREQLINRDVTKILRKYDLNKDHAISFEEFCSVVKQVENIIKDHEIASSFYFFDKDKNGIIDKQEMIQALTRLLPKDGDQKVLLANIETLFTSADKDADHMVTFEEFVALAKKVPELQAKRLVKVMMSEVGLQHI